MGHPKYEVTDGTIELNGENICRLGRDRAGSGRHLHGLSAADGDSGREDGRLPAACGDERSQSGAQRRRAADSDAGVPQGTASDKMAQLRMDEEFARRYVNDGFSGGEMKRAEILQLAMLRPKFAILDETDSGLDVDAVKLASQSIAEIGGDRDGDSDHHAPRPAARTQRARLHARDARRTDRRDGRRRAGPRVVHRRLRPKFARAHPEDAEKEKEMAVADKTSADRR